MKSIWTKGLLVAAVCPILFGPVPVRADHQNHIVKLVDADQLKNWIDQGKKMLLVDSRVTPEYKEGHIPTAINVPSPVMDQHRDRFPADVNYPIVFYCNGWPDCKKSHEACSKALQWGYKNVYWFRDGIPVWQSRGYPIE